MESRRLYNIGPFWSSEHNKDTQLNVFVSDKHFQIELQVSNLENSPRLLAEYLQHVEHLEPDYLPKSVDDFEDPLDELADWALGCFLPIFQQIPPLKTKRKYTLHECLFPETFHYSLCVVEGKLSPVLLDMTGTKRFLGALLPASKHVDYSMFRIYRPDEIQIPISDTDNALPPVPDKVLIKGQQLSFFKPVHAGDVISTFRELRAYAGIQSAALAEPIHTSKLLGIVWIPSSARIVGLLLSYIECDNRTLLCAGKHPKYASFRQKWLGQITRSLESLHAHGVIWGDAKPHNVLIDVQNDAYLTDFGGGYTDGWVDKELANTVEGDLQGLQRISEFLSE